MKDLDEFYDITDAEEYFEFFDLEYDEALVNVKRFHILRKFGEMVDKIKTLDEPEEKLYDLYKFALISVYENFKHGYNPTAAEIFKMFEREGGCLACSDLGNCSSKEGGGHGQFNSCSTSAGLNFQEG